MQLGLNIRQIRKQQHRTLQEIADACGFTKGLLSKIENGVAVPPVATLAKIAEALGVKASVLLEEDSNRGCFFTSASEVDNGPRAQTNKGYAFFTLAAELANKKMQPFLFLAKKGDVIEHKLTHAGEEFVYMLEGEMKLLIDDVEYILKPGDNIYFNALQGHGVMPVSYEVKYIAVFVE